ncbi:hypothetical protein EK21DRAFT_88737 [Setomelanomma holmii]|uniref:Uncharacterized protein n=1 Tax=Setomelanomma holmii TaxID=210430 RepID=A0A9P4LMW0_9PLEO|nr:hypothetical protein EK21DRAFT_88737 [Setomelanomma holmii]
MDPLSIGSAVVGLIASAARIAPPSISFCDTRQRCAKVSLADLGRDQQYHCSSGANANTLVIELEKHRCDTDSLCHDLLGLGEFVVSDTSWRLQAHFDDLSESMQEAENSMNRLVGLIEGLVASNTDLRNRIDALAADQTSILGLSIANDDYALESPTYEADLSASRPYRRTRPRDTIYSITSSQRGSMALSTFSDVTLGNVSVISVFCLPIWSADLSNSGHYRFGKAGLTLTMAELRTTYPHIDFPDPDETLEDDMNEPDEATDLFWTKRLYSSVTHQQTPALVEDAKLGTTMPNVFSFLEEQETSPGPTFQASCSATRSIAPTAMETQMQHGSSAGDNHGEHSSSTTAITLAGALDSLNSPGDADQLEILFYAASLFEFKNPQNSKETGIPYLEYNPGETSRSSMCLG